jgi:linoleoyl-CoA desaturase
VFKDYEQIVRYHKLDLLKTQGLTLRKALFQIVFQKLLYLGVTILLPIYMMSFSWWLVIIGFVVMNLIAGLVLALIFQSAHVLEETDFYEVDENGCVENNWAIHQMRTTANFATKARVFSWFVGGLNYQVEHHLFPNICHVHYKDIAPIVKQTANEFNVPYLEHRTFGNALVSHFKLVHSLGTGAYDRNLAKAS